MSILDISLTAGMRASLLSLQGTKKSIDRTQERLTTGRRVNSALDNPTNFFAAVSNVYRAADLTARKDGILEGIQVIKVADVGIKGIDALLNAMRGTTQAALGTSSQVDRNSLRGSFDELSNQISSLARDSSYGGLNLLTSQNVTMQFSETSGTSTLTITGTNNTATALGVGPNTFVTTRGANGTSIVTIVKNDTPVSVPNAPIPLGSTDLIGMSGSSAFLAYDDFFGAYTYWGFDATSSSSWSDLGDTPPIGVTFGSGPVTVSVPMQPWTSDTAIKNAESSVVSALSTLQNRSKMLSSNLNIATTRLGFISAMSNILQSGADNLTLADMNEESATMLTLQVRQNLGVSSLRMASQTSQSILQLF